MNRDSHNFKKMGEGLFGPTWQTALAASLGVSDRTVRRWVADEHHIPGGIWKEMASLCQERGAMLIVMAYHSNVAQIELNGRSLKQLEEGGHTGSNGEDTTHETKARLIKEIKNLEAANKMLEAAIKPLSGPR
jgi:hypothetical protein